VDTDCRCQIEHHPEHKKDCKVISNSFLHCVICDRTVDAQVCTTCYTQGVCALDGCMDTHAKNCVAPRDHEEIALVVDVRRDNSGILSIYCIDGMVYTTTMKSLITMLLNMDKLTVLTDRYTLVYLTFGGVLTTFPKQFYTGFTCEGPTLGVTFQNKSTHKVCPDGVYRTPTPTTLEIIPGGGGPEFDMDILSPLQAGVNLIKLQTCVIPITDMTPGRKSGSSG
jgi:hypothetical protein